jgi:hypothetical protein
MEIAILLLFSGVTALFAYTLVTKWLWKPIERLSAWVAALPLSSRLIIGAPLIVFGLWLLHHAIFDM